MVTPKELAEIIVDALTDAGIVPVNASVFNTAVVIAEEEIIVRQCIGGIKDIGNVTQLRESDVSPEYWKKLEDLGKMVEHPNNYLYNNS